MHETQPSTTMEFASDGCFLSIKKFSKLENVNSSTHITNFSHEQMQNADRKCQRKGHTCCFPPHPSVALSWHFFSSCGTEPPSLPPCLGLFSLLDTPNASECIFLHQCSHFVRCTMGSMPSLSLSRLSHSLFLSLSPSLCRSLALSLSPSFSLVSLSLSLFLSPSLCCSLSLPHSLWSLSLSLSLPSLPLLSHACLCPSHIFSLYSLLLYLSLCICLSPCFFSLALSSLCPSFFSLSLSPLVLSLFSLC